MKSFIQLVHQAWDLLRHWIFMQGSSILWELREPKIPFYDFKNLSREIAGRKDVEDICSLTKISKDVCLIRLKRGDTCHIIKNGQRLVNVLWILVGKFYVRGQGLTYDTGDNAVYLYGAFTAEDMRIKGLMNLALADIADYAKKIGRPRFISLVEEENRISIKYHNALGYQRIARIRFFKALGIKFCHFKGLNRDSRIRVFLSAPQDYQVI